MGVGSKGWCQAHPAQTYYRISRTNTYWIMASAAGFVSEGDVRQIWVCFDEKGRSRQICHMMFILFTVSEYATSAAAAFNLDEGNVVFMMPGSHDQRYRDVLFSVRELR